MIYFVLLFLLLVFSSADLFSKNQASIIILNKYLYFIATLILIFFAGLRFDTGWDYKGYHYYYDLIPTIEQLPGDVDVFRSIYFEPGFKILMSFAKTLGLNFYGFQFFVSALCVLLLTKAIRKEQSKLLFVFIYFSTCYLFLNMSVIRQGVAVAMLYLAVSVLFEGKKKTSIIYLLIGVLFHFSLVVMIPIFFIADKEKISNRILYIFVIAAVIVYVIQLHWLKTTFSIVSSAFPHDIAFKINTYLDSDRFGKNRDIGFGVVEKIVTFLVLLYINRHKDDKHNFILLRFFVFYMVIYFAFYEITVLYDRLRLYFVALNVFVYLSIFNYFSGHNKVIVYFIICAYSMFSYFNVFRSESNNTVFIPYNSIIDNEKIIPSELKGDMRIDRAINMDR